ncbi:MAG TPA: dihydrofolate reductase family protein, partial [Actinomycetota bacterium]|nr:dihydrofolate reductase family protein [Actinomycetota bacterium]
LLGRRTYEDFAAFWPNQPEPNPFTTVLNNTMKYVASTTLQEPLPWMNSTLLQGDAADALATVKRGTDKDLLILGSGALVRSLLGRRLVDRFVLLIHPLVLGTGQRLFADDGARHLLELLDTPRISTTGVIVATYRVG